MRRRKSLTPQALHSRPVHWHPGARKFAICWVASLVHIKASSARAPMLAHLADQDFGQVTGATFCPKGDCGEKAGRPWCVSPQFLKLYDGPIEINCKASGRGTTEQALAEDASIHSNHQKQLVEEDFWGCQLSSLQPPALRLCLEQLEDQGLFQ
ncbi:Uncharacterized protein SCF082_LOCUS11129 [Durusdinium trenchii]|uniref:Uncharacterized protein n=1 Tax=Durusdinium trenchii TaxID=1381693 RepID=A0ABP0JAV0_9DINO